MKRKEKEREVEMREIAEEPKPHSPRYTRQLFFAGMTGLVFITAAVLLYILFSII